MKNTIVILGDVKSKSNIDHLKRLLEGDSIDISQFCFIGWQLTFESEFKAEIALLSANFDLTCNNINLIDTIHLTTGTNFINFEGVRAEIIENEND